MNNISFLTITIILMIVKEYNYTVFLPSYIFIFIEHQCWQNNNTVRANLNLDEKSLLDALQSPPVRTSIDYYKVYIDAVVK